MKKQDSENTAPAKAGERIAKVLARAGVASRREVERMIEAGRISHNGKILKTPAYLVEGTKGIKVDGKLVSAPQETRLWRYHKGVGTVTTHKDPEGRKTVFETLGADMGRVISVGRLDITSEGLLLLTNDGELARYLEHPSTGWRRQYRIRVHGRPNEQALKALENGVTVDGIKYGGMEATISREMGANAWIDISLREGKNREVRKVMEHLGLKVNRLIRVAYGPFELGHLKEGDTAEIPKKALVASLSKDIQSKLGLLDEPDKRKRHKHARHRG